MYVYLINEMKKDFVDKCGGKEYVIKPGKAIKVPDYVAYHFIGNPAVMNGEDQLAADAEKKRIYMRYAAFKPEDRDKKIPKLRIEQVEEEVTPVFDAKEIAAKKLAAQAAQEEEFPSLKQPAPAQKPPAKPQPPKKG